MKYKLTIVSTGVIAFILALLTNNIAEPYFASQKIEDYHMISIISGFMFTIAIDTLFILLYQKNDTKNIFWLYLVLCPIFGLFSNDIFRLIGILLASFGVYVFYKRILVR